MSSSTFKHKIEYFEGLVNNNESHLNVLNGKYLRKYLFTIASKMVARFKVKRRQQRRSYKGAC